MAVERPHTVEEAWELVRAAGPYLHLTRADFDAALNYLAGGGQVLAGASAGGNWLYGGQNNQIVLQATELNSNANAGYNVAYGIAEIGLTLAR